MGRVRGVVDSLRKPTVASAVVALLLATILIVGQSDHGFRDVGNGIWWYEYYPFYTYSHGDFVRHPPLLPIYGNLALVALLLYLPVRAAEGLVTDEFDTGLPTLDTNGVGLLAGVVLFLGVAPLTSNVTLLDVLTLLLAMLLDGVGIGTVVETSSFGFDAASTTPAAALGLCVLYVAVRAGQHGIQRCRSLFRAEEYQTQR